MFVFVKIPVRDSEAHRSDRVSVTLRVSPGGTVSATLPAGKDKMHVGGREYPTV